MVFRTTLLQHCYSVLYQQDLQVFYASLNCRHPFLKLSVFFDQRSVELFVRNISPNFEQILTKRLERRIQSTKVLYELGQILVFNVTTSSHHILQIFVQARKSFLKFWTSAMTILSLIWSREMDSRSFLKNCWKVFEGFDGSHGLGEIAL